MTRADRPRPTPAPRTAAHRAVCVAAAAWTALYVASKVHRALTGELGVTGGPRVTADDYAGYGPGEVAAAQWGNAGAGVVVLLLVLVPLLPAAARANRWVVLVPLGLLTLGIAAGGVGMLVGALTTDTGGVLFGGYCLVWAALVGAVTSGEYRARVSRSPAASAPAAR